MKKIKIKQILTILIALFIFINQNIAQTSGAKSSSKPTQNQTSEIDRLYKKYKDLDTITLYTTHGEIQGSPQFKYNKDNKPQSIIISGISSNSATINEFISNLILQKIQNGFKSTEGYEFSNSNFSDPEINSSYSFRKNNMFFIVKYGVNKTYNYTHKDYFFSIETGDYNRFGGSNATKFDF